MRITLDTQLKTSLYIASHNMLSNLLVIVQEPTLRVLADKHVHFRLISVEGIPGKQRVFTKSDKDQQNNKRENQTQANKRNNRSAQSQNKGLAALVSPKCMQSADIVLNSSYFMSTISCLNTVFSLNPT